MGRNSTFDSPVTHHVSRITFHASRITFHASRFTHHASRFTHHASRFTHHASLVTFHASRFTHHSSLLPSLFRQILHEIDDPARITPLVVVPRKQLHHVSFEHARVRRIQYRRMRVTAKIDRY